MLFVAQVNAGGGRTLKVLVKFTAQYNPQAHALAAGAGLAPKLYGVQDVGGMKMVVMELLEDSQPWPASIHDVEKSAILCRELDRFLEVFGQANLVHGDLRPPNVHVIKDDRVCILDFDWAGIHGKAKYPIAVNPEESWAEGVQVAQPMLKEHDTAMVDKLQKYFRKV